MDFTEKVFQIREQEKDVSFRLKDQVIKRIDLLLGKGRAEAWLEIFTWYQLLKGKELIINKFWEFPILETMLRGFTEELKLFYSKGSRISVLELHTMKELTDAYFHMVFMLRRIEYDIDPANETQNCFLESGMSFAVVKTILKDARIFDKEKVERIIEGWILNGNGWK